MAENKLPELAYKIIKIHTSKFSCTELEDDNLTEQFNTPDLFRVGIASTLNVDKDKSTVTVDISTQLIKKETDEVLIEHVGRTSYLVKGLLEVFDEERQEYDFPDVFLTQLYAIAYSHARALLSIELSPTVYKDKYFIPVVNPASFFQNLKKEPKK